MHALGGNGSASDQERLIRVEGGPLWDPSTNLSCVQVRQSPRDVGRKTQPQPPRERGMGAGVPDVASEVSCGCLREDPDCQLDRQADGRTRSRQRGRTVVDKLGDDVDLRLWRRSTRETEVLQMDDRNEKG